MKIVTAEQYKIASEIERIAAKYGIPREELMGLVGLSFEAGQVNGLNTYAIRLTAEVNGDPAGVSH